MPEALGVTSASQVVYEDLSKAMEVLDQRQTPFFSRLRNGKKPEALLFSQAVDRMGKRRKGGVPERQDIKGFEGDITKKLYARVERLQRTPAVSVEAEELNRTAGLDANNVYNGQVAKKIKENKRDIDYWILSDQEAAEDDGINGSLFRGLGRTINDGASGSATSTYDADGDGTVDMKFIDQQTTVPTLLRTPTSQIYSDVSTNFTEDTLNNMMQARWAHAGVTQDFTLWVAANLKGYISRNFGRYQANKSGFTAIGKTDVPAASNRKIVTSGIDVFEGDFGTITVELEPFLPTTLRGYGVEMERCEKRVLYLARHTELENKGGGRRGLIDSLLGVWFDDPRGHFKIAPSDEVPAVIDYDF